MDFRALVQSVLHQCSALPGRERWEVAGLRRKPQLAGQLEEYLRQESGVQSATASPVSGRILVIFDQAALQIDVKTLLVNALRACAGKALMATEPSGQTEATEATEDRHELLAIIDAVHKPDKSRLTMAAFSVLTTSISLVAPLTLGLMVGVATGQPNGFLRRLGLTSRLSQLGALSATFLVFEVIELLSEHKTKKQWHQYATEIESALRVKAFHHVERLDTAYVETHTTGKLRSIIHDDAIQVRRFLDEVPHSIINKSITFLVGGLFLLAVSPVALGLALTSLPVCLWLSRRYRAELAASYEASSSDESQTGHQVTNSLSGLPTIKSFTTEEYELQRLIARSETMRRSSDAAQKLSSSYANSIRYAITAGISLPMIYTGAMVIAGTLSPTVYMLLIFVLPRLVSSMSGLDADYDLYLNAVSSSARLSQLLSVQPTIMDGHRGLDPDQVQGDLQFEDISFGYEPSRPIFKNFSVRIPAKQSVAFVGATGSGKSTLVKLLLRLYDLDEGQISLGGTDIRELRLADLRRAIGLVSQEVFLFQGTIYENIIYGRPDATRKEVLAAARAAGAMDFIEDLPAGFDTPIGERGLNLSGGQRQRLSIARALLKAAPILILDEATSAVDNETEALIQHSLQRIAKERTVIVIAHRLSTVRNLHRIFVLDHGQIAESGTHDELVAQDGIYAALWKLQTGELQHHTKATGRKRLLA